MSSVKLKYLFLVLDVKKKISRENLFSRQMRH